MKKKTKRSPKNVRKYPKLSKVARREASLYIAEEVRSGYPRKQAIAIGLSRSRAAAKKARQDALISRYL